MAGAKAPGLRSPRNSQKGASSNTSESALTAAKRHQGGVVRDGRDGYDVWHGIEQKRPGRKSMPSAPLSARGPRDSRPRDADCRKGRDGFEMFYGIAEARKTDSADNRAVNSGEWLKKVKELESQLQATLASGPDAKNGVTSAATEPAIAQGVQAEEKKIVDRRLSMPARIGLPSGACDDAEKQVEENCSCGSSSTDGDVTDVSPSKRSSATGEVQVFSVSTPAAPGPPPFLQLPLAGVTRPDARD